MGQSPFCQRRSIVPRVGQVQGCLTPPGDHKSQHQPDAVMCAPLRSTTLDHLGPHRRKTQIHPRVCYSNVYLTGLLGHSARLFRRLDQRLVALFSENTRTKTHDVGVHTAMPQRWGGIFGQSGLTAPKNWVKILLDGP